MKPFGKYLLGLMCMLCLAGAGNAQIPQRNRRKPKTEKVADTVRPQTMTHTMPYQPLRKPNPPKNPFVKFSNLDESVNLELRTYTYVAKDALKLGVMSSLHLQPFCRFGDKLDVGISMTQKLNNYPDVKTLNFIVQDIYTWGKARTNIGEFSFEFGKKSLLNYAKEFRYDMPANNFLVIMKYFKSGHFYQRVISAGFKSRGKDVAFKIGYAEEGIEGFKFTGNGALVFANELFIDETFKAGLLLTIGKTETIVDLQAVWTPTLHSALLLELSQFNVSNIDNKTGLHGTYRYICDGGNIGFFINGFTQFGENATKGWATGIRFPKIGAYLSIGQTKNDPLHKENPDGTQNKNFQKPILNFELGLCVNVASIVCAPTK